MKKRKNVSQSFEESAILLLLASVLVKLISAFFKVPLASEYILGDLGFGFFSLAHDVYVPIFMLASAGLPLVVSKLVAEYVAEKREDKLITIFKESKKLFLKIGGIIALALTGIIAVLFIFKYNWSLFVLYFLALVPTLMICCIISAYRGYYEGIGNMKPVAVSNIIEALGKLVFGLLLAYLTLKFTGNLVLAAAAAIFGIIIGSFLALIFLKYKFKKQNFNITNLKDNEEKGKIIATIYALFLPVVLSSMLGSVVSLIDALTVKPLISIVFKNVGNFGSINLEFLKGLSNSEAATYLYGVRSKVFTVYNLIPTFVSAILVSALPIITKSWSKGDKEGIKINVNKIFKFTSIIVFPASIGLLAFGKNIVVFLYGNTISYKLGGYLLSIYGITALFAGFSIILTTILQAVDSSKTALINIIVGTFFKVIFNIILIKNPNVNVKGAAYSTLICYLVIFILNTICLFTKLKFLPDIFNSILKPLISGVVCVGFAFLIVSIFGNQNIVFLISLILAVVVYIVLLLLFKCVTKEDYGKID